MQHHTRAEAPGIEILLGLYHQFEELMDKTIHFSFGTRSPVPQIEENGVRILCTKANDYSAWVAQLQRTF